jgi:hypothetical protein
LQSYKKAAKRLFIFKAVLLEEPSLKTGYNYLAGRSKKYYALIWALLNGLLVKTEYNYNL